MYKIITSDEAKREIRQEVWYSKKQWGTRHARQYRLALFREIEKIADNPLLFRERPEMLSGVRAKIYKGTKIVYYFHEANKTILILAVLGIRYSLDKAVLEARMGKIL